MGMTLDQLLDETGANNLAGGQKKTAAAPGVKPFSKLAERCRRAVETAPEEKTASAERDLIEKTAAIAILTRTLAEISAIDGQTKTAAVKPNPLDQAVFIKAALEAGHKPADIALFLEKQANVVGDIVRRAGRGLEEVGAGLHTSRAAKQLSKAEENLGHAGRKWESLARKYENAGDADKAAFIEKLRAKYNDRFAHGVLSKTPGFHGLPGYKALAKTQEEAKKAIGAAGAAGKDGISIGGHQVVSGKQIDKLKKPAALVGAGFLGSRLMGKKPPSDNKKGVVVVNS